MLISFSQPRLGGEEHLHEIAGASGTRAKMTWSNPHEIRFTLPGATEAQHESVIRALLELDPHARIRTARAVYESLEDYEAQVKARA